MTRHGARSANDGDKGEIKPDIVLNLITLPSSGGKEGINNQTMLK